MISRLRGVVREQHETHVLLDVQGVCYEVCVPPSIVQALPGRVSDTGELELVIFHYHQLEVGRGTPVLIGFLNDIEREFFARFISVSGIGPKGALRALTRPIPVIAQAIDEGDTALLRSLPGVGPQRAKEIVAKLQGKVGKYALMPTTATVPASQEVAHTALEEEAIAILMQLEYKHAEAKRMVQDGLKRNPKLKSSEDLLNAVYRQQRSAVSESAKVST